MTHPARLARTYGQFCPVAAALDVVGDRWVLLIMREMTAGRRRFSQIRRACAGIAPNLLTDRLRMLTARGLVHADEAGYALTAAGDRVRPVLHALAMFGVDHLDLDHPQTADPRDADAVSVARAFLLPYQRPEPTPPLRVRVVSGNGSACDVVLAPHAQPVITADARCDPDVVFEVDAEALWLARRDRVPVTARLTGGPADIHAFLQMFDLVDVVRADEAQ